MAKDKGGHGSESRSNKMAKTDTHIVKRAERLMAWDKRVNASYGREVNRPIGTSKYAGGAHHLGKMKP